MLAEKVHGRKGEGGGRVIVKMIRLRGCVKTLPVHFIGVDSSSQLS